MLDVREISGVTDFYIIVSGSSQPHLKALSVDTSRQAKGDGIKCYHKSGDPDGGWVVMDYVNVVVHIFSREAREYYNLESLWEEAPRIH